MRLLIAALIGCMAMVALPVYAQKQVSGKVTDAKTNTPLSNVTISVKGTSASALSGENGNFVITVPSDRSVLVVSYVGYSSKEVAITGDNLNISLEAGVNDLSEVVVVGYGTKIKKEVTASIARVTSKEFENLPLPSFEQALQGRASGVFINGGSGKLGQGLNIRVRGISSISANQQPFIVIDGVPVVSQRVGSATEPDNPLATLNPDDIESMEVLKDAASAAIYGSRGSNGVILITTKSGKQGKTRVNFGYFTGWSSPTRKQEFLNADQYRELFNVAAENSPFGQLDAEEEFQAESGTDDWASTNDVNWADQAFQKGRISQYTVSANGGDSRTKFLVSASYNDQKGIVLGNTLTRATGRVNVDHTLNKIFKFGVNLSLNQTVTDRVPSDNAFSNPLQLNALPPLHPLRDADGLYNSATLYYNNLIETEGSTRRQNTVYRTISNAYLEAQITPELYFRSLAGIDWYNLNESEFLGRRTLDGAPEGLSSENNVLNSIFTTTNTLNYTKSIGESSSFDALAGIEYQKGVSNGTSVTGRAFPSDRFTRIASAAIIAEGSSSETEYNFLSYFLRANYKLKGKYLFGASARWDGSSRFGRDNRYGFFPAASFGWIITEEDFLKDNRTLSFLKLRTSIGRTGNAEIGNFSSLTLFSAAAYADLSGLVFSQLGVPGLSWERTDQFDVGLDFGFLNNRISGEIDYYRKNTRDLLLNAPIPAISGFTTITKNIGAMENNGWDVTLNGQILTGKFRWSTSVNVSTYRNKVTELVAAVPPGQRTLGRLAVGQPFGQFYGRKYMGVDPSNGDALFMTRDGKTTNNYNASADTVLGNPNPGFYGGWNNRFSYKGFDLDIQCQFVNDVDVYNIAGFFQSVNGDYFDNQTVDQMNYWRQAGDVTNIPQPRLYGGNGAGKSSRWVQDASYFRVKNVNLGYNLPRKWLSNIKMESARVYVAANNLLTFTKYTGYDPEVNATYTGTLNLGHDFYTPPQARTITVGVNVRL